MRDPPNHPAGISRFLHRKRAVSEGFRYRRHTGSYRPTHFAIIRRTILEQGTALRPFVDQHPRRDDHCPQRRIALQKIQSL